MHSVTHAAAIVALVDATAGMMCLVTPCVSLYVTPEMSFINNFTGMEPKLR